MNKRIGYLFWILLLAFGLMFLIAAAQVLANRNINGLVKGNKEAAITFTINNRLQDLINLSFELESKISSVEKPVNYRASLIDSLNVLGYNISVLKEVDLAKEAVQKFNQLNQFTNRQLNISTQALQLLKDGKNNESKKIIDSLRMLRLTDSIYSSALAIEKFLEKDLQATFDNNTKVSSRLSAYNKILAILAVGAIFILGTIIINRHIKQQQLIAALEKAKTDAQQLSKIKDQFLANMSHEIRTPLNAITGFSKILSQTPLNPQQQQYTYLINGASNNLIHIVNDILDISTIEAGKLRIDQREFSIENVLQTVENMFSNIAQQKNLNYSQHIEESIPSNVKGDPDRLLQIIVNIVGNAIKFTKAGAVRTVVSKEKEEAGKTWIKFSVRDTGPGIPKDKQQIIFKRFEQMEGNDDAIKGTGLGLSIAKSITELMNGSIHVDSELGKGSVFSVVLPFNNVDDPSRTSVPKELPNQAVVYEDASVLLVEDNKVNQLLMEHALANAGLRIETAGNGRDAVELIKQKKYNLILLDIQMPVMDGYETIDVVRNKIKDTTPVIAMTAYVSPGEKQKCLDAGMNGYLSKPVDFPAMHSLLGEYLVVKSEGKKIHSTIESGQVDFLLELTGGDKTMAKKIVENIITEIPGAIKKLQASKQKNGRAELKSTLHYLVSTFSPLGAGSSVMQKIQYMRENQKTAADDNSSLLVDELIEEIGSLEEKLHATATTINEEV
ncbi:MAG: ATP-binding protein [Chitinophagaceae bacterium]